MRKIGPALALSLIVNEKETSYIFENTHLKSSLRNSLLASLLEYNYFEAPTLP